MIIKSSMRDYEVNFISDFRESLEKELLPGDTMIIDRIIYNLNKPAFENLPENNRMIIIDATETQKSYLELAPIIQDLIENGFKKNHRLFAVGGGITQDCTAFISSILYRGVDWLFYPTTLLAQGDSCIGSKTSINFGKYKNQIGNFYSPKAIFIWTNFLKTLERRELLSGLGEMAHYFLVSGEEDFLKYSEDYEKVFTDFDVLEKVIQRSLAIKKSYIEIDEFDKNERQVFNYGHSFGHAIEALTDFAVPHGIAVSIGMDMANFFSVKYGYMSSSDRERIREFLKKIWKGYSIKNLDQAKYESALRKDKKNKGSLLGLILSKGPGKTFKDFHPLDEQFSAWLKEYFDNECE